MNFLSAYLKKQDFASYEDFIANYKLTIPENFNFAYDIVDRYAAEDPDKIAMVWCNDHDEEYIFTFSDMKRYSDKAANVLLQYGIQKGDAVMLLLKRRYEYWFTMMALCKIGAIAIPATHLLTDKDIEYRNNAAGIKMIIAVNDDVVTGYIRKALETSPTVENVLVLGEDAGFVNYARELEEASDAFERIPNVNKNTDPMLIYFSSGTTGMPKMALHNFIYPLGHIMTAKYWHNCIDGGLHLTVADTGWAKAGWGKLYGQWIAGSAQFVYDMDKFVPMKLAEKVTQYKVTTFCAPPTIYRFMIKEDLSGLDFSHMKYCTVAGEPLNPEVFKRFKAITGLEIKEGFGQSETTPILATFPFIKPIPGSTGKPSPLYDIDLIDEDGNSCDIGEEGEIVIRTAHGKPPGMFDGYYRDPERTAQCWIDGIYHTGDMAWRDEDGYFWFIGRADDVIKSSGYRIGPFEVESALIAHAAVVECAISAAPDPIRGQIVKATVVLAKGYAPSEELIQELQDHVKRTTAPYKYPRIVEFVDELPKTVSGKIKRKHLREASAQQPRE